MPTQKLSNNLENKYLDLHSVNELPETHAWTFDLDDHPFAVGDNIENVPIVDLNDENAPDLIGHACKSWGVFQVLNHGIPTKLLNEIESAMNHLFSLPMEQKLLAARQAGDVSGYGPARISCFFPKLMWSEGFTIAGSPEQYARLLWPHDHHKFCDMIQEYREAMKPLANRLMRAMLGWLGNGGVTKEELEWAENGWAAQQLNYYPACPDPARAMGMAAHTDSTILTILHQSSTCSGLQVRKEGCSRWTAVQPQPGALVVHVGDLLHILSNGLYPSVLHRAVVNTTHGRMSAAYLYGPPSGVEMGPLARLVDNEHPPLYRSITWAEYLSKKATLFCSALASIRVGPPAIARTTT